MPPRVTILIGNFFFSVCASLTLYAFIPYLSSFIPETYTGLVISLGGLFALIFFPSLPRLVSRYGAQQLFLVLALADMLSLFGLAATPGVIASIAFIVATIAMQSFLAYSLDLLFEASTNVQSAAGRGRASFLTTATLGALAAPLLLGTLLTDSTSYASTFLVAAAALIPLLVLFAARALPQGTPPATSHLQDTLASILRDRDFSAVTFGHFVLYLFYVWSTLYIPFYLHTTLGMPWSILGWILAIMLVPYVFIEYPAGWVADRYLGERDLLFAGFLLTGGALALLSLLNAASAPVLVLAILLIARAGAALIESMTEAHFFRRVTQQDINSMSIFRAVSPLAYVIAPIAGSIILYLSDYRFFFLITGGFIALSGAIAALWIRDVRTVTR